MKRGKIEPGMDMNKVLRGARGRTAISPPEPQTDASRALNAFIRGEAVAGEASTPEEAAELAANENMRVNPDGTVRKVPQGNAGDGTSSLPSGKHIKNFGERMRDLLAERKRLGL